MGYFTGGASWNADYSVVLGRGTARITGQAAIPSSTLKVDDAEVQLLAGSVGRASGFAKGARAPMLQERLAAQDMARSEASEEQVGEAHLYTIPGRISLEPGVT